MDVSVAAFLAIIVIAVWAPRAIRNQATFRNSVTMLLLSLGISVVRFAIRGVLNIDADWLSRLLEFGSMVASVAAMGLVLFAVLPDAARRDRSPTSDDNSNNQRDH